MLPPVWLAVTTGAARSASSPLSTPAPLDNATRDLVVTVAAVRSSALWRRCSRSSHPEAYCDTAAGSEDNSSSGRRSARATHDHVRLSPRHLRLASEDLPVIPPGCWPTEDERVDEDAELRALAQGTGERLPRAARARGRAARTPGAGRGRRRRRSGENTEMPVDTDPLAHDCPTCGAHPGLSCRDITKPPPKTRRRTPAGFTHMARKWASRSCPKCTALPGEPCRSPMGSLVKAPHARRRYPETGEERCWKPSRPPARAGARTLVNRAKSADLVSRTSRRARCAEWA